MAANSSEAASTSGWQRPPAIAHSFMVASSHPLVTQAGIRALERGGNAVDAALAMAAVATVAEPNTNGLGGDMFAMVWKDGVLDGLNASGRSAGKLSSPRVAPTGPDSVTVPGALRGWSDLADRYGCFGLDEALSAAAELADRGVRCTSRIADFWTMAEVAPWPTPGVGNLYRIPELARTLRKIAEDGPEAFYRGDIAQRIASCCPLSEDDLAEHVSEWVQPLRLRYRGIEVCELPPNGQGAAALLALALFDGLDANLHSQIEAMKLAFADAYAHIGDAPLPMELFDEERLVGRRQLISPMRAGSPPASQLSDAGTIYLCAVDQDGMAVSLIQSLYMSFGSGVVAPGTGVVLQNRGACFTGVPGHPNALAPRKRPFHTIMPGMLLREGDLLGPFGVVGGAMQPPAHLQVVNHLVDEDAHPQAALDAPRWRLLDDWSVELEPGLVGELSELRELGHQVSVGTSPHPFGSGQMILRMEAGGLIGGSDGRADGYAAGA
jgi:gamma-glutamyltranspeptidase/glutathione hydrolase